MQNKPEEELYDTLYEVSDKNVDVEQNLRKAMSIIFGIEKGEFTCERLEDHEIDTLVLENGAKISAYRNLNDSYVHFTLDRASAMDESHHVRTLFILSKFEDRRYISRTSRS